MKHGKSIKEYLVDIQRKTSALPFKEKQTKRVHGLHSNFRQIHQKLEIGTKPDAECLARSVRPIERSRKRLFLLRTQPQANSLISVDLGLCYCSILYDFFGDIGMARCKHRYVVCLASNLFYSLPPTHSSRIQE